MPFPQRQVPSIQSKLYTYSTFHLNSQFVALILMSTTLSFPILHLFIDHHTVFIEFTCQHYPMCSFCLPEFCFNFYIPPGFLLCWEDHYLSSLCICFIMFSMLLSINGVLKLETSPFFTGLYMFWMFYFLYLNLLSSRLFIWLHGPRWWLVVEKLTVVWCETEVQVQTIAVEVVQWKLNCLAITSSEHPTIEGI